MFQMDKPAPRTLQLGASSIAVGLVAFAMLFVPSPVSLAVAVTGAVVAAALALLAYTSDLHRGDDRSGIVLAAGSIAAVCCVAAVVGFVSWG